VSSLPITALVRVLVVALLRDMARAIRSVGSGFILAWKSIRSIIPKPIKDNIEGHLGAIGIIGGIAAIYAGLGIMGYQVPWWFGVFPLLFGIVLVGVAPFYAGFFSPFSLRMNYPAPRGGVSVRTI